LHCRDEVDREVLAAQWLRTRQGVIVNHAKIAVADMKLTKSRAELWLSSVSGSKVMVKSAIYMIIP